MNLESFPIGATVRTVVHSLGGRSETVTGTVTDHKYGQLRVRTEFHGTLCVPPDRAELVS